MLGIMSLDVRRALALPDFFEPTRSCDDLHYQFSTVRSYLMNAGHYPKWSRMLFHVTNNRSCNKQLDTPTRGL